MYKSNKITVKLSLKNLDNNVVSWYNIFGFLLLTDMSCAFVG